MINDWSVMVRNQHGKSIYYEQHNAQREAYIDKDLILISKIRL